VHEQIYRFLAAYAYRSWRCRNSTIIFSFPTAGPMCSGGVF